MSEPKYRLSHQGFPGLEYDYDTWEEAAACAESKSWGWWVSKNEFKLAPFVEIKAVRT